MANTDSNLITNLDASPPVANEVGVSGGRVRVAFDSFSVTGTDFDADGDTVTLCRLPAEARIKRIELMNATDMDSSTDMVFNVGIYDVDGNVKDEDNFASALTTFQTTTLAWADVTAEASGAIAVVAQTLWVAAGYTKKADVPKGLLDIVLTQTATVGGVATSVVAFAVEYTID